MSKRFRRAFIAHTHPYPRRQIQGSNTVEGQPAETLLALALAKAANAEWRRVPDRRARIDRRQQTAPPPGHERRSGLDRRGGPRRRREIRQMRAELSGHSREEKQAALEATGAWHLPTAPRHHVLRLSIGERLDLAQRPAVERLLRQSVRHY